GPRARRAQPAARPERRPPSLARPRERIRDEPTLLAPTWRAGAAAAQPGGPMNDTSTFHDPAPVPVHQGVAPTAGAVARATTGLARLTAAAFLRGKVGLALAAAGSGLVYSSRRRRHVPQRHTPDMQGMATMTIDASPDELYQRWRDVEGL